MDIWAVDIIGGGPGLPPGPEGQKYILVCVDPFSKWVELGALPDKTAESCADFFYTNVVARYGIPRLVRSDNGGEFQG